MEFYFYLAQSFASAFVSLCFQQRDMDLADFEWTSAVCRPHMEVEYVSLQLHWMREWLLTNTTVVMSAHIALASRVQLSASGSWPRTPAHSGGPTFTLTGYLSKCSHFHLVTMPMVYLTEISLTMLDVFCPSEVRCLSLLLFLSFSSFPSLPWRPAFSGCLSPLLGLIDLISQKPTPLIFLAIYRTGRDTTCGL